MGIVADIKPMGVKRIESTLEVHGSPPMLRSVVLMYKAFVARPASGAARAEKVIVFAQSGPP